MEKLQITIKLAGDSGDGIQLTGHRLAMVHALFGHDVVTFSDYPAEIRAPKGTLYGVSAYQLQIGSHKIYTPGDEWDILVALNPAALQVCLPKMKKGGKILVDENAFVATEWEKIGLNSHPLDQPSLQNYDLIRIPISQSLKTLFAHTDLKQKEILQCKNFFALGMVCWLVSRPIAGTQEWLLTHFSHQRAVAEANIKALHEGYTASLVRELLPIPISIHAPQHPADGTTNLRFITGNTALALGALSASETAKRPLFFASYPITPASTILHDLAQTPYPHLTTFQAEDEIAAIGACVGAAYGGALGVTATSGPGFVLMSEFINLAVMSELPCVIFNIQRAGPSTGMPTKSEQADLGAALWGRNGESPVVVLAPSSPVHCYDTAYLACKIALERVCVVIVLSDAALAGGHEVWQVPALDDLPPISIPSLPASSSPADYQPYQRHPQSLARTWVAAGTPGYAHIIGGLEKTDVTGQISYDAHNHQRMTDLRAQKIQRTAELLPPPLFTATDQAPTLLVSWGSTYGAITQFVRQHCRSCREQERMAHAHLIALSPMHPELKSILERYSTIIVVENNSGHALTLLRASYPHLSFVGVGKNDGMPWTQKYLKNHILPLLHQPSTSSSTTTSSPSSIPPEKSEASS